MISLPIDGCPQHLPNQDRYVFDTTVPLALRHTVRELLTEWRFLPNDDGIVVSLLPGGANNVNLILKHGTDSWAMKVREADPSVAGTSVSAAIEAQTLASTWGLAPAVVASSLPSGHFMSAFVSGETLRPHRIKDPTLAPQIIAALKRLHGHHFAARKFDIFDDIRNFMAGAHELGGTYPQSYTDLWEIAKRFENILAAAQLPTGFCHNDLVPQNFIACEDGVKLVDFDYAGEAWIAIDLASVTSQAEMSDGETLAFLRLYDPHLDDGQLARVQMLRFVNALREVAWAAMAEPFMSAKTTLLEGWTYGSHANVNIRLAETLIRTNPADKLASRAGYVRPGALF